jgi:hypothetical protein
MTAFSGVATAFFAAEVVVGCALTALQKSEVTSSVGASSVLIIFCTVTLHVLVWRLKYFKGGYSLAGVSQVDNIKSIG